MILCVVAAVLVIMFTASSNNPGTNSSSNSSKKQQVKTLTPSQPSSSGVYVSENFESYADGSDLIGQGGWVANSTFHPICVKTTHPTTKVGRFNSTDGNARGAFWTLPGTMAPGSTWNSVTFVARPSGTIQRFYPWIWCGLDKLSIAGLVAFWDNGTIVFEGTGAKLTALQPYAANSWYLINFYIRLSDSKMFCIINGTTYMNGGNFYSPFNLITPSYARVICAGPGLGDIDNITCSWMQLQPTATFQVVGPPMPIIGQSLTLLHTGSNGNTPATYQWNFGDGSANSTLENAVHTYTAGGTYLVKYYIQDVDGDSSFSAVYVTIYTQNEPFDELNTGNLGGQGGWTVNSSGAGVPTVMSGPGSNKYADLYDSSSSALVSSDWPLPGFTGSGNVLPPGWQWIAFAELAVPTNGPRMCTALRSWSGSQIFWQAQLVENDTFLFNNHLSASFLYAGNTWYYFKVYFNSAKNLCWMQYTTAGAPSWTTFNNSNTGYPMLGVGNPGKLTIWTGNPPTGEGKFDNISCSWLQPRAAYYVEDFNNWPNGVSITGEAPGEHVHWVITSTGSPTFQGSNTVISSGDSGLIIDATATASISACAEYDTPSPQVPSVTNQYWQAIDVKITSSSLSQVIMSQVLGYPGAGSGYSLLSFNANGSLLVQTPSTFIPTGFTWSLNTRYTLVMQCLSASTSRFSLDGGNTWTPAFPNASNFTGPIEQMVLYTGNAATSTAYVDNLATSWTQLPLSASFTSVPVNPINGTFVSFFHTGNNGAGSCNYQWNFGDPSSPLNVTTENAFHFFSLGGKYKVVLFIQDCFGNTAKQTTFVTVISVPSSPQLLAASNGLGKVMLTWQAPVNNGQSAITNYYIYRGTSSALETLYNAVGNFTSYNDTVVTQGLTYYYKVSAINGAGEGAKSNEAKIAVLLSSDQIGDQWPMFHGALNHTGVATTTPVLGIALTWTYATGGSVTSSPAVVSGRLYVGSNDAKVYCLNASSGAFIWSYSTLNSISSSPAVADGRIYVASLDGKVYCLNATNGAFIWSYTTTSSMYSSPAVVNGRVYVGGYDKNVYCLNATNGAFIWSYTTGGYVYSSPAVVNGRVYVGSYDDKMYCLNATNGAFIWSSITANTIYSSPAVVNGRVYFGSFDGKVYCLNATNGAGVWSYPTAGSAVQSSPAFMNGRVYVGGTDGRIYCLNATSGAFQWSYTTSNAITGSSPAVSNGRVYEGSYDGNLYCLNATTGALAWSCTTGGSMFSSPAVIGGHVYVGSNDNKIYCLPMVITPSVPSAPQSLTAIAGNGQVILNWAAPASNGYSVITNYKIYRGATSGTETLVATLGVTLTYTAIGLTNGVLYYFQVSAINAVGEGPRTAEVSATPAIVPSAPTGLTAVPQTSQILLIWNAPASNGGSPITNYKIFVGTTPGGEKLNATIVPVLTFTVLSLKNGQIYYFKVAAVNIMGAGANSTEVSAIPGLLPGAPTGLTATSQTTQVTLNWGVPASNGGSAIIGYKVYQGTTSGGETLLATLGNVTTYTNTGLTNNQAYYFKVAAINAIGTGTNSTETSATPRPADICITQIQDVTGRGVYVEGENFLIRVYFTNFGGTDATVSTALTFGGYAFLSMTVTPAPFLLKAGLSVNENFTVTVLAGATNALVAINATASCVENVSGRNFNARSTTLPLNLNIQGKANLIITSVAYATGNGTYVGGMSLQIRLNYQNLGGTDATGVMGSLVINSTYVTVIGIPTAITVPSFSLGSQIFTLTVSAVAPNINVGISATATGFEKYTSRPLAASGGNLKIAIQAPANVGITGIAIRNPRIYIGGESFQVQVKYRNIGGTAALNVVTALNYNGYLYLSANASASITVPASGGTAVVYFLVTATSSATSQNPVLIDASYTGSEQYSGRALNGASNSTSELKTLAIQSQANLLITSIQDITAQGTYVGGQTFVIRVNYQNTGGTAAISVVTTLNFNGYGFITSNASSMIIVPAGGTNKTNFLLTLNNTATSQNPVRIDASFTGNEQYSNRALSGATTTANDLTVIIQSRANVIITSIVYTSGSGTYVGGMVFTARVNYQNTGGTLAQTVTSVLSFGGYSYISQSTPASVSVPANSGTAYQDFTLTVSSFANPAAVTINATWSGKEQYSNRAISGNAGTNVLFVNIQSQAVISILSITYTTGNGTYVGGVGFTILVTFQNTGGTAASVSAVLTFGGYVYLSQNTPSAVTVNAFSSNGQYFTVTASTSATTATVTINATWSGTESISGRVLNGNAGNHVQVVSIKSEANGYVDTVTDLTGQPQYLRGQSLRIRVVVRNTGGIAVYNGIVTLFFSTTGDLTTNVTQNQYQNLGIAAGGSLNLYYNVTVSSTALGHTVTINANLTCTEYISNRIITKPGANTPATISINVPNQVQISTVDITHLNAYVRGYNTFLAQVTITNNAPNDISTGTLTMLFGGASGFSTMPSSISGISCPKGQARQYNYNVTVSSTATLGSVVINASFAGSFNGSAGVVTYVTSPNNVMIQTPSAVAITSIVYTTGSGVYVVGMFFNVRVTYNNTGGTLAQNVKSVLTFGVLTGYIAQTVPASVSVPAGGSATQDFTLTILNTAFPFVIAINATWTGMEQYSSRALSGNAGMHTCTVTIKSQAVISITSIIYANGTGTYVAGMSFSVRITFQNTGGVWALAWATLTFGSYTYLSQNTSAAVNVTAGGTKYLYIAVTASTSATTSTVTINATIGGTEGISGRSLSGNAGSHTQNVLILSRASITITNIAYMNGTGTYVGGMSFQVRVTFQNTGGVWANVGATLTFGGYAYLSQNTPAVVNATAGSTQYQYFTVTALASATTAAVTINATWLGAEGISGRLINGNAGSHVQAINIQSRSSITITSIIVSGSNGVGPYVGGMGFTATVTFSNTAGGTAATVSAVLTFGGYSGIGQNTPSPVSVSAGSTNTQAFTVNSAAGAASAVVTINATWTGNESISNRAINGYASLGHVGTVTMQSRASVSITSIGVRTGNGTYVASTSFKIRVYYFNAGGTTANSISTGLSFNGYSYLTSNSSGLIVDPASSSAFEDFLITVSVAANTAAVNISCSTWTGSEAISSRALSGTSGYNNLIVNIQSQVVVSISNVSRSIPTVVGGMSFVVSVTFTCSGGAHAVNITASLTFGGYSYLTPNGSRTIALNPPSSNHIDFLVTASAGATTQSPVYIYSSFTGVEAISGRALSGSGSPPTVSMQSQASVSITSITYRTGAGTYVGGMWFVARVSFSNIGGTTANGVTTSLNFGGYAYLTPNASRTISISAGGSGYIDFNITVAVGATTNNSVLIRSTWSGTEQYSSRALNGNSGSNNLVVTIQSRASVSITSINYRTGTGTYVGGMTFVARVNYQNTGGAAVNGVQTFLAYGGYVGISSNTTGSITIPAGGTSYQDFLLTLIIDANTNNSVKISATWTGTEAISSRALNGNSGTHNLIISIQTIAIISITSITLRIGTSPFVGGQSFTIRVNYQNIGGTVANNVQTTLTYGGYGGLSENITGSITINPSGTAFNDFLINVAAGAATQNPVTINVTWTGVEAISGRGLSGNAGTHVLNVAVQSQASVSITSIVLRLGTSPFVGGQSFTIRVNYQNAGGTAVNLVQTTLTYGGYSGLSGNITGSITVSASGTAYNDFLINVAAGAATQNPVTINATWGGFEAISSRPIGGNAGTHVLSVAVQSQASVSITSIALRIGASPFVGGQSFTIRVNYQNIGGTAANTVQTTLTYGGYVGLSGNVTGSITISAGGTAYNDFLINIAAGAATQNPVTINATWTGLEAISSRGLSGNAGTHVLSVAVQSQASVSITSIGYRTGIGTYVGGMTFVLRVNYQNTGGTSTSSNLQTTLSYGGYSGLTGNLTSSITVAAGSTAYNDFQISVATSATTATVVINATWTASESISGRGLSGNAGSHALTVYIQSQAHPFVGSVTVNATQAGWLKWVLVIATIRNSGGALVTNGNVTLSFNSSFAINSIALNASTGLSLAAGSYVGVQFKFQIQPSATNLTKIGINATFMGMEQYSNRLLSCFSLAPLTVVTVYQSTTVVVSLNIPSGRTSYVQGEQFVVKVTIDNSGGSVPISGGALALDFGGATGFSSNATYGSLAIGVGLVLNEYFQVTISAGASASCNIRGHFTATTPLLSMYSNAILVTSQAPAVLTISSIVSRSGAGPFVGGMTFVIRVNYQNTGGTAVNNVQTTLTYGGYSFLTANSTGSITVPASGTAYNDFLITAASGATTAAVTINATWTGTQAISNTGLNGNAGSHTLTMTIQSQASVSITSIALLLGTSPFVGGQSFTIRVTYLNVGGTAANTVQTTLTYGGYGGLSSNGTGSLTVAALGGTAHQDFLISVATSAATQSGVTIEATWTGTEAISGRGLNGLRDWVNAIAIQSQASVSITSIVLRIGASPFVGGQSFTIRVNYQNTGGTTANAVTTTLSYGGYSGLSGNTSAIVVVAAGGTAYNDFLISVAAGAATQNPVTINATWGGLEAITSRPISGNAGTHVLNVAVQSQASVSITSIALRTGTSPFVGGQSFTIRVNYQNTGGTTANTVLTTLNYGGYGGMSGNATGSITVPASGTAYNDFLITIAAGAATQNPVMINATWTGVEAISARPLSGNAGTHVLNVALQSQASVSIMSFVTSSGNGTYIAGMSFTVTITYKNTGGTQAQNVNGTLTYGSYTGVQRTTATAAVNVNPAGGTATQTFTIQLLASAASINPLTISCSWNGTEQYSGRVLSSASPSTLNTVVRSQAIVGVSISIVGGRSIFVGGESFTILATYTNTGGAQAQNVNGTLSYGGYSGILSVTHGTPVIVNAGSGNSQSFVVSLIAPGIVGTPTFTVSFLGVEEISGRVLSGTSAGLGITVQSRSIVAITSFVASSGNGTYVAGMTFTVTVTYTNTGGTQAQGVNGTVSYGGYSGILSTTNTAPVSVNPSGGTATQVFTIQLRTTATSMNPVIISCSWTGVEQYSGRALSSGSPFTLNVAVQSQAVVSITNMQITNGTGTYVGGMSFGLQITYSKTGGASATAGATLSFGSYTSLSQNSPAPVNIGSSGTQVQNFVVTVATNALSSAVTINATWTGTEAISGRSLSGNAGSHVQSVTIQKRASISISSITCLNGTTFVGGMVFTIRVVFNNTGGTTANASATLTFGGYAYLSQTTPLPVTITAGGTQVQNFVVTVSPAAISGGVIIGATWTGSEAISNRVLSGNSGSSTASVSIQSRAAVSITSIQYTNGTGTYVGGMSFSVRVTFSNTGNTSATADAVLSFGAYTYISQNNPVAVTVAATSTQVQDFAVSLSPAATSSAVVINATWTGTEAISGRLLNGNAGSHVQSVTILKRASISITSITCLNGTTTFVGSMAFGIRVTFNNTGGTSATVGAMLTFGAYPYLNQNNPALIIVASGTVSSQDFMVSILASATSAAVIINATWTGTEAFSGRALSGNAASHVLVVKIQSRASITITQITYTTGNGTYVAGMAFNVNVTFNNAGNTSATVDAVLQFNGYGYMSQNVPAPVIVAGYSTKAQSFTVTTSRSATTITPAVIDATWNATEAISGRTFSGNQGAVHLNVNIQGAASLEITSVIDLNNTSPYGWSKNFTIRVTIENEGQTAITSILLKCTFESATGITTSPVSYTGLSLAIGQSKDYLFTIFIANGATLGGITTNVTAIGTEMISNERLSTTDTSLQFIVEAPPSLTINTITTTTPTPYTNGSILAVMVQLINGGANLANGTTTLILHSGFLVNGSSTIYNIYAGTSRNVVFMVTIGDSVTSGIYWINASFAGYEAAHGTPITTNGATTPLYVTVLAPSNIAFTSITDAGTKDYVQGMSFNVSVHLQNNGGLGIQVNGITLLFNGASTGFSYPAITPFLIGGTSSTTAMITVSILVSAPTGQITVTATATCNEQVTNRSVIKNSGATSLAIRVTSSAVLSILGIANLLGQGVYVEPHSFTIRVSYINNGGTSALNVHAVLSFNGYAYLSSNSPASITVAANGGTGYQDFTVTILAGAQDQVVSISATVFGSENKSGRALSAPGSPISVTIQGAASISFGALHDITGLARYVQGMSFDVSVSVSNTGGTDLHGVSVTLTFNATGYTASPAIGNIHYGSSWNITFTVTISNNAQVGTVSINARATGTENITGDTISNLVGASTPLNRVIQAHEQLSITTVTDITAHSYYIQGQSLLVNVTLDNSAGGTDVIQGTLSLVFNGMTGYSSPPQANLVIHAGQAIKCQFNVSISSTAQPGRIPINATFNGKEAYSNMNVQILTASGPIKITCKTKASMKITAIVDSKPTKIHKIGTSFLLNVTLTNQGGASAILGNLSIFIVSAENITPVPLSFTGITSTGGHSVVYSFSISIAQQATMGNLTINLLYSGKEELTMRSLSFTNSTWFVVQPASNVVIEQVEFISGPNPLTQGVNFQVRVRLNSHSTVGVIHANLTLTFSKTGYSTPLSHQNMVIGGSQIVTYNFIINIDMFADYGSITIDAQLHALESGTLDHVDLLGASQPLVVQVIPRPMALALVTGSVLLNSSAVYQGQQNLILRFNFTNTGGAAASVWYESLAFTYGYGSQYTVVDYPVTLGLPFNLNKGQTDMFAYSISVDLHATTGVVINVQADIYADDAYFNNTIHYSPSVWNWTVIAPPRVQLSSAIFSHSDLVQGENNVTLKLQLNVPGIYPATISSITLRFMNGTTDYTSSFKYSTTKLFPFTAPAGVAMSIWYSVNVSANTNPNLWMDLHAAITASFTTRGYTYNLSASMADTGYSIIVRTPAALQVIRVTCNSASILNATLGQIGLNITVFVQNLGGTGAKVSLIQFQVNTTTSFGDYFTITTTPAMAGTIVNGGSIRQYTFIVTITSDSSKQGPILVSAKVLASGLYINNDASSSFNGSAILILRPGPESLGTQILNFILAYWFIIIPGVAVLVAFAAIGARRAKVKKALKAKAQQGKGKEYFAKQMAASTGGKLAPFMGKEAPIGKSAKNAQEAAAHEEARPQLTPEQLAEQRVTEAEVSTFKEKKICLVHKGPVAGNIYLCPQCDALYCVNCAQALKKAGEKCWQCGSPIVVSDAAMGEAQVPQESAQAMVPGAPASVTIPGVQYAAVKPSRPAGPSFVSRNMSRIDASFNALGMPSEMKMKYLKEMNALPEVDQARFLMDMEKEAFPGNVVPTDISAMTPEIEDKLVHVQRASADPATSITEQDIVQYLNQDFTTLEHESIDLVNTLPWPKEKKLALLKEMLALTPQERALLLQEMFQQEDENE